MKKYFCDRCGKEIVPWRTHWIKVKEYSKVELFFTPLGEERDQECVKEICEDCQYSFYAWWNKENDPVD